MTLTDMVIMPGADYQNTCNAIREKTGGKERIKSGQLLDAVDQVFLAGGQARDKVWENRFYSAFVRGNGERNFSVSLPFEPDYVLVGGYDPFAESNTYSVMQIERNFKTFGTRAGRITRSEGTASGISLAINNNTIPQYVDYSNGMLALTVPSVVSKDVLWREESNYYVIACKYTEDGVSEEELLKNYVVSLPDSGGTVTISQRRFAETGMTTDSFNAFAAENKPNWTFVIA